MPLDKSKNPWNPDDEGDHYPIKREWWTIETIFKNLENNRKWNLKIIMSYNMETPSCFYQYALFDITSGKCIFRKDIDDKIDKFIHKKNEVYLQYDKTIIKGLFPKYNVHLEDEKHELFIDMDFNAISLPHWLAQDIAKGNLPFGWNFYRYGFIPNCDSKGSLKIKNKSYKIQGKGYFEHVWGEWSYQNPLQKISGSKQTILTYINLAKWWISHHKPSIPNCISFTTENNIFGYDWNWGIFDNGWSLFYGNILFWINDGPTFGVLYITPDGENYWEFRDINFHYNKLIYVKDYDIYFPSDMILTAKLGEKKVNLRFWLTTKSYEYIDSFKNDGFYKAFILSEMPGNMEGEYTDGKKTLKLQGDCKMMPLRQPSILGHNELKILFTKPPNGIGIDVVFDSHYLKKHLETGIQFKMKPKIKFNIQRLKNKDYS